MLTHAASLICTPALQSRTMPSLHPCVALERSPAPMSPLPEPRRQSLGYVPLSARVKTLRVPRLPAYLQRPHPHAVGPEQTGALVLDPRDLSVVPLLLVPAHRQGVGCPYPHQLSLVLVVAQCGPVL